MVTLQGHGIVCNRFNDQVKLCIRVNLGIVFGDVTRVPRPVEFPREFPSRKVFGAKMVREGISFCVLILFIVRMVFVFVRLMSRFAADVLAAGRPRNNWLALIKTLSVHYEARMPLIIFGFIRFSSVLQIMFLSLSRSSYH